MLDLQRRRRLRELRGKSDSIRAAVRNYDVKMPPGEQSPPPSAPVRDQARFLRRTASEAERRLWARMRNHGLGVKFRRQHPIGSYIVGFFCREAGLVVEVDPRPGERDAVGRPDGDRVPGLHGRVVDADRRTQSRQQLRRQGRPAGLTEHRLRVREGH